MGAKRVNRYLLPTVHRPYSMRFFIYSNVRQFILHSRISRGILMILTLSYQCTSSSDFLPLNTILLTRPIYRLHKIQDTTLNSKY
jgi:hypothetical protein